MSRVLFKKHKLKLDGRVVTFVDEGSGEPLIFLHPLFTSWEIFKPILPSFVDRFRVVALDLPGFGDSQEFSSRHSLSNYARFLARFFDALDLEKAIVFGVSLGGTVGFKFASQYPAKVKKLIVQGAPFRSSNILISTRGKVLFEAVKRSPFLEKLIAGLSQNQLFWVWIEKTNPRLGEAIMKAGEDKVMEFFEKLSPRAVMELGEELLRFDLAEEISGISIPVRLIIGAKERVISVEDTKKLNEILPDSRLEVIKGEDHEMVVENPKALTLAIRRFILEEKQYG